MKNWKTTISGTVLIVSGIVLLGLKLATWVEASALILPGIGLLVAKDYNVSGKP